MAGGIWIAMHHSLVTNPKVKRIHRGTGAASIHETIGRLAAVWWMADEHSDNGTMAGSVEDIDDAAGFEGFGVAMILVGWLVVDDDLLTFPNFGDHNGKTAKRRLKESKRMSVLRSETAAVRKASANRTQPCALTANHRTEQNRTEQEEKTKTPAKRAANEYTPEFEAWWSIYPARPGCPKGHKGEASKAWDALRGPESYAQVRQATEALVAAKAMPKDAQRFLRPLRGKGDPEYMRWLDIEPATVTRAGNEGKPPLAEGRLQGLIERSK